MFQINSRGDGSPADRLEGDRAGDDAGRRVATLARTNLRLNWFYEVTPLNTSLGLLEAGLGISVLPKLAPPQGEHTLLVTRPIVDPVVTRTTGLAQRRSGRLSPASERFLEMLIATWKQ